MAGEGTDAVAKDRPGSGTDAAGLLHDLTRSREALARSIARNNLDLASDQITAAVNRILLPLLFLRMGEDRHLVPEGSLAGIRNSPSVADLYTAFAPYADALYAGTAPPGGRAMDPGPGLVIEEPVAAKVLAVFLDPARRYHGSTLETGTLARVLMQYLTRRVRRSAAHQATVVDTHDAVIAGKTIVPPQPLVDYLVRHALSSGRGNRSAREILPLRIFDPACGSGQVLLAAYRHLLDEEGSPALTFEERREILVHSVHGLDRDRHAVAATRMLLVLGLFDDRDSGCIAQDFRATALTLLHDFRHTILCGNALVGPEIEKDESWMFCPARDRHGLSLFSYREGFPEILAGSGFDVIVCNPPEGPLEQREWLQQYFQRHFAVYHPGADRSAYFFEKSLSLVVPGGTVAFLMGSRFLRGAAGSPLRELLATRRIEQVVDGSEIPAGKPGAGLCLVRVRATRPGRPFPVIVAGEGFAEDPEGYAARHSFPVSRQGLDQKGWAFRDTRAADILEKLGRHSTPLAECVMDEVHPGVPVAADDPRRVDEMMAREWLRKDPRCKPLVRNVIAGSAIGRYHAGDEGTYLLHIPTGWTCSHPAAVKKPWPWFRHRHPLLARHLLQAAEILKDRAGPDALWWESTLQEFWQMPRPKILFPARSFQPAFFFDTGRGIGNEASLAIPSAGLYLVGILNSRLMQFVLSRAGRTGLVRQTFTWDEIRTLPVYTPDFDRPEDLERHTRIERLVRRRIDLERICRAAPAGPERNALQEKIHAADRQIDRLVYSLYGLTPDEIAIVEHRSPADSPS